MYQQPHDEPHYPQNYPQSAQPQFVYVPQPPAPAKPKNKTMKTLAIVFVSVGLALTVFSIVPTVGVLFGVFGFACSAMALIFVCLI